MRLRESLLEEARGTLKRFALKRLIGDRDARGIIRLLRERYRPKDVLVQQQKVARAEALAFIAPVRFLSFPAILKGWLDRVWTPGFAYDLTPEAWRGAITGRQPKLTHAKALIIQTTIFDQRAYDAGTARTTPRGVATWQRRMPWVRQSRTRSQREWSA
jgi:NAD(P)H dehydrogenase (quinone)